MLLLLIMMTLVLTMLMTVLMTRLRWVFLRRSRCWGLRFPGPASGPRVEVPRAGLAGAVGLSDRRKDGADAAATSRRQRGAGGVRLNVDGSETFAEDRVVGLKVNVQHRTA